MGTTGKVVGVIAGIAVIGGGAYAIYAHNQKVKQEANTVVVGTVGDSDRQLWEFVAKRAKQKYGVTVKIKMFTDYVKPNTALIDGSIDLNSFQTISYFNVQNKHLGNKMTSIGKTYITPIRLYSKKHTKLSQIPDNGTVVVPNDASNEKRALDVLAAAGLIKYDTSAESPTVKDVTSNPKHLTLKEVDSDQAASSLASVDAAVVNTNYALDAGLKDNQVLYTETINKQNKGYINIIVAKKGTENKASYKKVVKAYQSDATKKQMKKLYGDAEVSAWDIDLK